MTSLVRIFIFIAALITAAASAALAAQKFGAEVDIPTAPVEIDGHVLFHLRGAAALRAEVRAARVKEHIEALAADPNRADRRVTRRAVG